MREYFYRMIGKAVAIVGIFLFIIPLWTLWFAWISNPDFFVLPIVPILVIIAAPGFILMCVGSIIYKRHGEMPPFLAQNGDIIHSAQIWKRGGESGLYLTTCGFVVSVNDESNETAHVGYRLVRARRATCSDCIQERGRTILETQTFRREY